MFQATESLVPIMLLVALGAGLFKSGFITSEVRRGMDLFTYWVALPSLFIFDLSGTDFRALEAGSLVLVLAITMVTAAIIAAIIAWIMRLSSDHFGVFIQVGFRGNLAFVGLPLIIFAMEGAENSPELVSASLIALAAMVPLNNMIAVMALLLAKHKPSLKMVGRTTVKVVTNPLIVSALIGGFLGWMGWTLPTIVGRPFELLGQTALALALVSLGGALIELELRGKIGISVAASVFKVAMMPLIAFGLTVLWGLAPEQTFIVMVFSACPAATASYILTTQLGGDDSFAAAAIVISTLMSFFSLAVVLMIF